MTTENCFDMYLKVKKLCDNAVIPAYAHMTDAGFDLTATSVELDERNLVLTIGSGLAFAIPEGYVGLLFPRSSVYKTEMTMTNCVGVIDAGYRGEVKAKFYVLDMLADTYKVGDRFAQMVIVPFCHCDFVEVSTLPSSDRGANGFGSTGK